MLEEDKEESTLAVWDCGSPLYDSHELVSLSHLIERHLMVIPSLGGSKTFTTRFYYPYDVSDLGSLAETTESSSSSSSTNSIMSVLSEFVGMRLWKRRSDYYSYRNKEEKRKIRSRPRSGLTCFCNSFGFSLKK